MVVLSAEEAADRLLAMRQKEEEYHVKHYFPSCPNGEVERHINVTWREKIVTWSYNVIDQ